MGWIFAALEYSREHAKHLEKLHTMYAGAARRVALHTKGKKKTSREVKIGVEKHSKRKRGGFKMLA